MRYDGYYMLSDYLEIPNLRQKASRMFQEVFSKYCLGSELPVDPFMPSQKRHWFVIYAVATTVYQFVILFGVTLFLYTVLKPYGLQSIGIMAAVFSLTMTVGGLLWSLIQLIRMPRPEPLSKWKVAFTLCCVAGLIALSVTVPIPWYAGGAVHNRSGSGGSRLRLRSRHAERSPEAGRGCRSEGGHHRGPRERGLRTEAERNQGRGSGPERRKSSPIRPSTARATCFWPSSIWHRCGRSGRRPRRWWTSARSGRRNRA